PYTGRDDAAESPQPESLFSIQFAPAYMAAIPARLFRLSAQTIFIALTALVAFGSALAVFWLIGMVTEDERVAATGALVVLCLGTFALVYAPLRTLFGLDTTYTYEYFPYLRRYVPAVPFPLFFIFCAFVWRALTSERKRAVWRYVFAAGGTFAFLVFSYFYLWTAAAAWLACLAALWLIARPEGYRTTIRVFASLGALAGATLLPYFALVKRRAATMDSVQLLAASHAPDFSRSSIKLGLIVCAVLAYAVWRGRVCWRDRTLLLAASFALTPLVVFNQQVVTGYSLQPLHYELFIAKYLALLSLVLMVWHLSQRGRAARPPGRALACACFVALAWAMVETGIETKRHAWGHLDRDETLPVARRLAGLARDSSGALDTRAVVLYFNLDAADFSPTVAPEAVLWAPHTPAFSGVTTEENRERLYQYLYYTNEAMDVDAQAFDSLPYRKRFLIHSMIEWGHNDPAWTVNWRGITPEEVRAALSAYARYRESFGLYEATHPALSYVVTDTATPDFTNLDRWYERGGGERVGRFTIYRVRVKGER
ncbi:MAG: hypothetical protein M3362_23690, partial [Acidobacteriota bacterium]|nr:hypothetical protein [Acidobacteriota bacterium]